MLHNVSRLFEENILALANVRNDYDLQYQLMHTYQDHEPKGKQRIRYVDAYAGKSNKSCDELHSLALALLNTLPSADHIKPVLLTDDTEEAPKRHHSLNSREDRFRMTPVRSERIH
jgi:hypothetical protein